MKTTLSFLLVIVISISAFAGDKAIAEELKSRTLIVKLLTEDEKIVKSIKKDASLLSSYQQNIKASNSLLKKVIKKYWDFNSNIIYKTGSEIEAMIELESKKKKKERQNYAVLYLRFFSNKFKTREESAEKTDKFYTGDASYLHLDFWEGPELIYTSSPRVIPTEADFVFMVRNLYHQVVGMQYDKDLTEMCKENAAQVRDKVLLLTSHQASELEEKDLKKVYPYSYKIVSQKEIDEALVNADSKYICVVAADQSDTVVLKFLVLTGTGKIAGYHTDIRRPPLSKKDFKEMCKYCD